MDYLNMILVAWPQLQVSVARWDSEGKSTHYISLNSHFISHPMQHGTVSHNFSVGVMMTRLPANLAPTEQSSQPPPSPYLTSTSPRIAVSSLVSSDGLLHCDPHAAAFQRADVRRSYLRFDHDTKNSIPKVGACDDVKRCFPSECDIL